jgi:DNA-binding GntR family transcriptional regulator
MPRPKRSSPENQSVSKDALVPVEMSTLHQRAYDELKSALMEGRFQPGQTITLRSLAEALGTSVMPVRDAVRQLAGQQALEMLPNRIIRVPRLSRRAFDDMWTTRVLLEGEACALAAGRSGDDTISAIRKSHDRVLNLTSARRYDEMRIENRAFFFQIYRSIDHPLMLNMIEMVWMLSGPLYNFDGLAEDIPFDYIEESLVAHEKIIRAIEQRSAEKARSVRQADLKALGRFLLKQQSKTSAEVVSPSQLKGFPTVR